MQVTKVKGDLGELKVATDLTEKGFPVAFPFGDNRRYDLIAEVNSILLKIQVKYTTSDGNVIVVRLSNNTKRAGKILQFKTLSESDIDYVAVYDKTVDSCFYIPIALCKGMHIIRLRLTEPKNKQIKGIHWAQDFATLA